MNTEKRGALMALLKAAREWAPSNLTRTGAGEKERLERAVRGAQDVTIKDLDPCVASFRGADLQDLLDGLAELALGREDVWGLDFMVDPEGLKIMVNRTHWSPGHGSVEILP